MVSLHFLPMMSAMPFSVRSIADLSVMCCDVCTKLSDFSTSVCIAADRNTAGIVLPHNIVILVESPGVARFCCFANIIEDDFLAFIVVIKDAMLIAGFVG